MNIPLLIMGTIFTTFVLVKLDSNRLDYYYNLTKVLTVVLVILIILIICNPTSEYNLVFTFVLVCSMVLLRTISKRMDEIKGNVLYKKNTYEIVSELADVLLNSTVVIKYNDEEVKLTGNITAYNCDVIVNIDKGTIEKAYCAFNFAIVAEIFFFNAGLLYMTTTESMFIVMGSLFILIAIISVVRRLRRRADRGYESVYLNFVVNISWCIIAIIFLLYLSKDRSMLWNLLNTKI